MLFIVKFHNLLYFCRNMFNILIGYTNLSQKDLLTHNFAIIKNITGLNDVLNFRDSLLYNILIHKIKQV